MKYTKNKKLINNFQKKKLQKYVCYTLKITIMRFRTVITLMVIICIFFSSRVLKC